MIKLSPFLFGLMLSACLPKATKLIDLEDLSMEFASSYEESKSNQDSKQKTHWSIAFYWSAEEYESYCPHFRKIQVEVNGQKASFDSGRWKISLLDGGVRCSRYRDNGAVGFLNFRFDDVFVSDSGGSLKLLIKDKTHQMSIVAKDFLVPVTVLPKNPTGKFKRGQTYIFSASHVADHQIFKKLTFFLYDAKGKRIDPPQEITKDGFLITFPRKLKAGSYTYNILLTAEGYLQFAQCRGLKSCLSVTEISVYDRNITIE